MPDEPLVGSELELLLEGVLGLVRLVPALVLEVELEVELESRGVAELVLREGEALLVLSTAELVGQRSSPVDETPPRPESSVRWPAPWEGT